MKTLRQGAAGLYRALRQIADYGCRLTMDGTSPERKVAEFIRFLPVLAYDGSSMKRMDASLTWEGGLEPATRKSGSMPLFLVVSRWFGRWTACRRIVFSGH